MKTIYNAKYYRDRLQELEYDLSTKFDELLNEVEEFNFANMTDTIIISDNLSVSSESDVTELPVVEYRNSMTGKVKDLFVVLIDKHHIMGYFEYDNLITKDIKFHQLSDIRDRINLLESMQDYIEYLNDKE